MSNLSLGVDCEYERIGQADVYVGSDMAKRVPTFITATLLGGHVAVIYFDEVSMYALPVIQEVRRAGFKVYELCIRATDSYEKKLFAVSSIPDYVRFVIGVGTGSVARLCSHLCTKRAIEFMIYATAPSTDGFLSPAEEIKNAYSAKYLVADRDVLNTCPKKFVSAGWGIAFSEPLRAFEMLMRDKIFEAEKEYKIVRVENARGEVTWDINDNISESFNKRKKAISISPYADNEELFWYLVRLSEQKKHENFKSASETFAEILMQSDGKRLLGEYTFIATYLLWGFYTCYLGADAVDVLLPPDKVKSMKLLEKKCGIPFSMLLKRIDFFTVNGYFRIKYILGEYREDLLAALKTLDYKADQRRWRRLYDDAGYWLKETFTVRELLSLMALSGELSGGLLGFAKASGALEDYI